MTEYLLARTGDNELTNVHKLLSSVCPEVYTQQKVPNDFSRVKKNIQALLKFSQSEPLRPDGWLRNDRPCPGSGSACSLPLSPRMTLQQDSSPPAAALNHSHLYSKRRRKQFQTRLQ